MIRTVLMGRLGADPIGRESRHGKPMITACIAVNVAKPNEAAVTEWIDLVGFGNVGELLARHVKGDVITVMGSMTKSTFTGRDGEEKSAWGVLVEALLSVRTVRNDRPRERRETNSSTRPARSRRTPARLFSPSLKQSAGNSGPLPNDRVDDLYSL
jgi:single-strand DNA-binding protein